MMSKPYISVIIPTYNRVEKLEKCLSALKLQSLISEQFEVIVVDDGSQDDTKAQFRKWQKTWPSLHLYHQKNSGQGVARNLGIEKAQGEILLFLGDDIYATKGFLQEHLRFHQENPDPKKACLGLTLWDPNQKITPFMRWLTEGGPQFAYHRLKTNEPASFWFFYTSNVSLKKNLLKKERFNPKFRGYGWEDTELAFRLEKRKGLKLMYKPEALAHHDHPTEESSLMRKMQGIAENALIFQKMHPNVSVIPKGFKLFILRILSSMPAVILLKWIKRILPRGQKWYWYVLSKRYFLQGLSRV